MKNIVFVGNSLEKIREFPEEARRRCGYELDRVQRDLEPLNWKPFPAIGQGVREIRVQIGEQYRVIYLVKVLDCVHVLHAFQKKTQKTRQADIELAKKALSSIQQR